MKTVSQYNEDIKLLMKKAADINAKCVAENRDPMASELSVLNEIMDTVKEHQTIIATLERQEKITAELASPANSPMTRPGPQQNQSVPSQKQNSARVVEVRDKDRFKSLGEQLAAVIQASARHGQTDPRLYNAATGLNETVNTDGGFLVQQDFTNELLQQVFQTGILASRCRRMPISANSNSMKINGVDETSRASTRYGGVLGYWVDEAGEKTASKPKFRVIELSLKKLVGLCYATDELLQDAAALEGFIRTAFPGEFGFLIDNAIIRGTGAGQPLGLLNSGSLVSVTKETGQQAATIMAENIIKMYSRRFASMTGNYVWYYNQNIEPQLFTMSQAVGTGGIPVYMPPGGLSDAPYGRLMGLPAIAIEQASTLGTQGDIILANLQDGYILAEKGGIQSDMSIHVRFVYDESVFRFVMRIDGQPQRATALTPANGGATSTQSHFIVLDTRA